MSSNKMPEQYSLKWNNFHANLTTGFHGLFEDEDLVDVSLAVEGKIIQAHKVILSVCSPYFKSLFRIHPEKHPIVFLKDVGYSEVIGLLQFMYQGQVDVSQEQLAEFLRVAEMLQVKGLTSNSDSEPTNNSITPDIESMIPLPVLSTLANKVNNINGNTSNITSQNNALKRKKPPPTSSTPMDNCEPIFKIVSVESLKRPKLVSEEASAPASTNGISSTGEQDTVCDSPTSQGDLPLTPSVQMIPKMEPVEEYSESNFTDYSDIGENFMSHFMEEPPSDSTPQPSQQNYSLFTPDSQQGGTPKSPAASSAVSSDNAGTAAGTSPNKLTSQQIMNIDVSLLQDPFSRDLSTCEVAQVISKKLFYRGYYYRREKMTYNKKLMWKCISYSKSKCHSRIHTFDGHIIYSSDTHNHPQHSLASDQSVFHSPQAQAKQNHVYRDGHDFIGRPTTVPDSPRPSTGPEVYANNNTKLSLTKNICYNLQNITKTSRSANDTAPASVSKENNPELENSEEKSTCDKETVLPLVFNSTITEIPNSLGKLTKCAVKQELITCTPEIC